MSLLVLPVLSFIVLPFLIRIFLFLLLNSIDLLDFELVLTLAVQDFGQTELHFITVTDRVALLLHISIAVAMVSRVANFIQVKEHKTGQVLLDPSYQRLAAPSDEASVDQCELAQGAFLLPEEFK